MNAMFDLLAKLIMYAMISIVVCLILIGLVMLGGHLYGRLMGLA